MLLVGLCLHDISNTTGRNSLVHHIIQGLLEKVLFNDFFDILGGKILKEILYIFFNLISKYFVVD
mgnify:CR=1 FL=1